MRGTPLTSPTTRENARPLARKDHVVGKYTFKDLARDVLTMMQRPMTAEEIWRATIDCGAAERVGTNGKTPWATISAQMYTSIKEEGENSAFVQLDRGLFGLRSLDYGSLPDSPAPLPILDTTEANRDDAGPVETPTARSSWIERDLHPPARHIRSKRPAFPLPRKNDLPGEVPKGLEKRGHVDPPRHRGRLLPV
jgi:hypothetical protein